MCTKALIQYFGYRTRTVIRILFVYLLLPFFIHIEFANAQIGKLADVIDAAQKKQEQAYIPELMAQLCEKIYRFAHNNIRNQKEKLAWLHTMRGIVRSAYSTARHAASNTGGNAAKNAARNAAWGAAVSAAGSATWDARDTARTARRVARDTARKAMRDAAKTFAFCGAYTDETGQIDWELSQWASLNWLLQNIESVLEQVYPSVLITLADDPANNPFESDDSLSYLLNTHFGKLNANAIYFVMPWLLQIVPVHQFPSAHQPQALLLSSWPQSREVLLGSLDDVQRGLFSIFPQEIIFMLFSTMLQVDLLAETK